MLYGRWWQAIFDRLPDSFGTGSTPSPGTPAGRAFPNHLEVLHPRGCGIERQRTAKQIMSTLKNETFANKRRGKSMRQVSPRELNESEPPFYSVERPNVTSQEGGAIIHPPSARKRVREGSRALHARLD